MAERWKRRTPTPSAAPTPIWPGRDWYRLPGGGTCVASARPDLSGRATGRVGVGQLGNRAESDLLEALGQGHILRTLRRLSQRSSPAGRNGSSGSRLLRASSVQRCSPGALAFAGSDDLAVELLARMLAERERPSSWPPPWWAAWRPYGAAPGRGQISGCDLWDEVTGECRRPFVLRLLLNRPIMLLTLAKRIQVR